jgi:hypothetical protein
VLGEAVLGDAALGDVAPGDVLLGEVVLGVVVLGEVDGEVLGSLPLGLAGIDGVAELPGDVESLGAVDCAYTMPPTATKAAVVPITMDLRLLMSCSMLD